MAELNNRATKLEALQGLIEERNAAAKNAEEELILYIKNVHKDNDKNDFNSNFIVDTIQNIRYSGIKNNNNTYPTLLEWIKLDKLIEKSINGIKQSHYNISNNNENSIIAEGKRHGFNVDDILKQLPQLKKWYQFWRAGRKTQRKTKNRKRSGGNFYRPGMENLSLNKIMAAKSQAKQALNDATFEYQRVSQLYKQNPTAYQLMAIKLAADHSAAKSDLNSIEDAEYKALEQAEKAKKAEETRRISLGRPLNNAAREARKAPRTSSWLPSWGRGGRKTHHKKHHMRKGSRKIHRK